MKLDTDFGLVVGLDAALRITVKVPGAAMGCVDGLCRDFDLDPTNDLMLPDGTSAPPMSVLGNNFQVWDPEDPE